MPIPFVKWAGGKRQALKFLLSNLPSTFERYHEPFVGGGALFFALTPPQASLSDSNGELIATYQAVKEDVEGLIERLSQHPNEKEHFLKIRNQNPLILDLIDRAARFIYLNKTCYNGLYRVNKKNEFNVPFGGYKNPKICNEGALRAASKALQDTELTSTYFHKTLDKINKDDFVYLDPPYFPVSDTSFVDYSKKGFLLKDHETLATFCEALTKKGVKFAQSNADVEWVRLKYSEYRILETSGSRSINSKADGRGKVNELLIVNY